MRKVDFITPNSVISPKKSKTIFFLRKRAGKIEKVTPDFKMGNDDPYGEIINFSYYGRPLSNVRNSTCGMDLSHVLPLPALLAVSKAEYDLSCLQDRSMH